MILKIYPTNETPIPKTNNHSLYRTIHRHKKIDPILIPNPTQITEILTPILTDNDLILIQKTNNIEKITHSLTEIKLKPQTPKKKQHN